MCGNIRLGETCRFDPKRAGFSILYGLRNRHGMWSPLRRPFLLFASLFDGSPEQYLSDFGTLIPDQIDTIWYKCVGYPGARDGGAFVQWLNSHQFTGAGAKEEISYAYYGYDADGASGAIETTAAREDLADPQLASVPLVVNAVGLRRALQRIRDLPELTDPGLVAEVESVTVQTMRLTAPKPRP